MSDRPRCVCGVYIDCHHRAKGHAPRKASRLRLWFRDHSVWQHVAAPIWLRLPEKARWTVVGWLNRSDRNCWTSLASDALAYREDDACDIHVPSLRGDDASDCRSRCDWMGGRVTGHAGEHACACYCGKFRFMAYEGAGDRQEHDEVRPVLSRRDHERSGQ